MNAVISVIDSRVPMATKIIGTTVLDTITRCGRTYLFYCVNCLGEDEKFIDPFDDELLIECRYFADESAARDWVKQDIAFRNVQPRGVQ